MRLALRQLARGSGLPHPGLTVAAVVAASLVVSLVNPLTRPEEWVGWLPTTVNASESAVIWTPTLLSATAAWISGQPRSHGLTEWVSTSPRNAAQRLVPSLILVGSAAVLAQILTWVVLLGVSLHYGLADGLVASDLLISAPTVTAYLLTWVVIGAWLGHSTRRELSLPIAALLPYAVFVGLAYYLSETPFDALAIADGRAYDYIRPTASTIIVRALFWSLLMVSLWCAIMGFRRTRRVTAWATSLAAALALFQGATYVELPRATTAVCAGSGPVTCLQGAFATSMGRYRLAVAHLWPSIPPALRPDIMASEPSVVPREARRSGEVLIAPPVAGDTEPARVVDERLFAAAVGDTLFIQPCDLAARSNDAAIALVLWWRMHHQVPVDGSAFPGDADYPEVDPKFRQHARAAAAFSRLPNGTRQAWFKANADRIRSCTAATLAGR